MSGIPADERQEVILLDYVDAFFIKSRGFEQGREVGEVGVPKVVRDNLVHEASVPALQPEPRQDSEGQTRRVLEMVGEAVSDYSPGDAVNILCEFAACHRAAIPIIRGAELTSPFAMAMDSASGGCSHSLPISNSFSAPSVLRNSIVSGRPVYRQAALGFIFIEDRAQVLQVLVQSCQEGGDGEAQVRYAERDAPCSSVPVLGMVEQTPDPCVGQPDADRQVLAVAFPFEAAWHEYLDHVAVVLFQPPDALFLQPSGYEEGHADVGGETFDEHTAHHPGQHRPRIVVDMRTPGVFQPSGSQ